MELEVELSQVELSQIPPEMTSPILPISLSLPPGSSLPLTTGSFLF